MSLFLKVIGALATGAGTYLTEKAKMDYQAARDALLFNRELALKAISHRDRTEEIKLGGEITRQNTSHAAKENRVTDKLQAGLTAETTKEADERRQRYTERNKAIDFKNDVAAKKLAARLGLIEADFVSKLGKGEIVQDATGNYHLVDTRSGAAKPVGVKGPLKSSEGGDSYDSYRQGGTAAADTKPSASFHSRWANATEATAPGLFRNGQKIPVEEAWRQYQGN